MPNRKALQEFTDLYYKKYGIHLEKEEALSEMSDFFYIVAFASGKNHLLIYCSSLQYMDLE